MTKWSWHVEPVPRGAKCAHCQQPVFAEPSLVRWTDGELYHVGCLLDRQASHVPMLDSRYG